jgi:flagellar biosynthesis/type III secretory pathway protein FliH
MKKVFILLCAVLIVTLASCGYSKDDLSRARSEGYQEGFDDGYHQAKYEASAELEQSLSDNLEQAFEKGYEHGYEDGFWDGVDTNYEDIPHETGRIEKDRND